MTDIKNSLRSLTAAAGWRLPAARSLLPRQPVILVYHGVPRSRAAVTAEAFERQLLFLKQNFDLVSCYQLSMQKRRANRLQVMLTFDDGFRNNAEVVAPILRRHQAPAVFFVSSRHAEPGKYLWFSYLQLLETSFRGNGFKFRGEFLEMSPAGRRTTIARLRASLLEMKPHPAAMYSAIEQELPRLEDFNSDEDLRDCASGMTAEQVGELGRDPLFTIGGHTVDHPFLTQCDPHEAGLQIANNKQWLERLCGAECQVFAYPAGDYSESVMEQCRAAGFSSAFSVASKIERSEKFEIPRIGIYYPSLNELGFKIRWGYLLMRLQSRGIVRPEWSAETQGRN
jgi:peptidoglycan/xylan/chitin deacetylase (PgdA/CDA1 family)